MEKPEIKGRFVPFKLKIDVQEDGIGLEIATRRDMRATQEQRDYMDSNILKALQFLAENYQRHADEDRAAESTGEPDLYAELASRVNKTVH